MARVLKMAWGLGLGLGLVLGGGALGCQRDPASGSSASGSSASGSSASGSSASESMLPTPKPAGPDEGGFETPQPAIDDEFSAPASQAPGSAPEASSTSPTATPGESGDVEDGTLSRLQQDLRRYEQQIAELEAKAGGQAQALRDQHARLQSKLDEVGTLAAESRDAWVKTLHEDLEKLSSAIRDWQPKPQSPPGEPE